MKANATSSAVFKGLALSAAALLIAGLLAGCNTMAGIGQDVEEGGEAVQEAAS